MKEVLDMGDTFSKKCRRCGSEDTDIKIVKDTVGLTGPEYQQVVYRQCKESACGFRDELSSGTVYFTEGEDPVALGWPKWKTPEERMKKFIPPTSDDDIPL